MGRFGKHYYIIKNKLEEVVAKDPDSFESRLI
jgi:hypothetical protein